MKMTMHRFYRRHNNEVVYDPSLKEKNLIKAKFQKYVRRMMEALRHDLERQGYEIESFRIDDSGYMSIVVVKGFKRVVVEKMFYDIDSPGVNLDSDRPLEGFMIQKKGTKKAHFYSWKNLLMGITREMTRQSV